jgi:HlyD family secretion protein
MRNLLRDDSLESERYMFQRIAIVAVLATVLLALVIYSQTRPQANYVSGLVEAEEIRLGSRVGGRVKSVFVNEGDKVTAGTRLIEFEPYDLHEREQQAIALLAEREAALRKMIAGLRAEEIAQAKAHYDQAVSQLSLVEAGPRSEEISAAKNRLESAIANQKLATREEGRLAKLFQTNAISKSEFDEATERLEVATAVVGVTRDGLDLLKAGARSQEIEIARAKVDDALAAWELAQKGFRKEEIEQVTAARDAASGALAAIRIQQEELTITAPSDGTIDSLDLQPGDLVGPNAPVMTMLSNERRWVRTYVPQRFLQLAVGQQLKLTFDSFPDESFVGEVTFISRQAEFTPSNVQTPDDRARQVYRIRVTLDDKSNRLRPGMTANVWLDSADTKTGNLSRIPQ